MRGCCQLFLKIMVKIVVGNSKIDGKGIFTANNVQKGCRVFIFKGKIINYDPKTKNEAITKPNVMGYGRGLSIDPYAPFTCLNHSCDPNIGQRGRVLFVALRNIKKGEELTFDYSISEDSLWMMKCTCSFKNCRKIIRGIRYLPEDIYNKRMPYIPKYFQSVYNKYRNKK